MGMRQVTVTTARQEIVAFNKARTTLTIINRSGVECFISEDQTDIAGQGFPLAVGQAASFTLELGDEPANAIYCLTSAGTADLRINEGFGPRVEPALRTR